MSNAWTPPTAPNPAASGGQQWQAPYAGPLPATAPKKKTEPAAIIALLLALLSIVVWFVPGIVAIFLASGAKRNIAASDGSRKGKELALAAQIVSAVMIVIAAAILGLLLLV